MKIKIISSVDLNPNYLLEFCLKAIERNKIENRFLIKGDYINIKVIKKKYGYKIRVTY